MSHTHPLLACLLLLALAAPGCPPVADDDDDSAGDDDDSVGDDDDDSTGLTYGEIIAASLWADDIDVDLSGETLTVADDGVPDHDVLERYALMDGSTVGVIAAAYDYEISMAPEVAASPTDTNMGAIGVAISGAVFFNPWEGDGTSVAIDNNFDVDGAPFLDACSGHPLPDGGTYHYHGIPYCVTDVVDTPGEHSVILGVLFDGFAVYGGQGVGGTAPTDLDECSGHSTATPEFPGGMYHYHLTDSSPYSIPCYRGTPEVPRGGGPPGGGGGPPMAR